MKSLLTILNFISLATLKCCVHTCLIFTHLKLKVLTVNVCHLCVSISLKKNWKVQMTIQILFELFFLVQIVRKYFYAPTFDQMHSYYVMRNPFSVFYHTEILVHVVLFHFYNFIFSENNTLHSISLCEVVSVHIIYAFFRLKS